MPWPSRSQGSPRVAAFSSSAEQGLLSTCEGHIARPVVMAHKPSAEWVHSIDAVYQLFEDPETRAKYPTLSEKVRSSVQACESALRDYGLPKCAVSFNGGKDCTVLVHILAAVLRRVTKTSDHILVPIPSLYVACSDPFSEVKAFIQYAASPVTGYALQLWTEPGPMQDALRRYMESDAGKEIEAIFIGLRYDDPHGPNVQVRAQCDPSWPAIMRIHPLLQWTYTDVWEFLRCPILRSGASSAPSFVGGIPDGVPYCKLYDKGYTSLGSQHNTVPNPTLATPDGLSYKPAYFLTDSSLERAGRLASK